MKLYFIILTLLFSHAVNADSMHIFKDKNGNVSLSKPKSSEAYNDKPNVTWETQTQDDVFPLYEASIPEIQKYIKQLESENMPNFQAIKEAKKQLDFRIRSNKPDARIGMNAYRVRNQTSWGEPKYVNTTITKHGKREQWVYDHGFLYFTNGKLSAIQY